MAHSMTLKDAMVNLFESLPPESRVNVINSWTVSSMKNMEVEKQTTMALKIANDPKQAANCGVYVFASSLGQESLKAFFNFVRPNTVPTKLVNVSRSYWIAVFETHEIAQEIITRGHGRLPFPGKFPYFNSRNGIDANSFEDDLIRIDMSWAEKKSTKGYPTKKR